jgi:chromosomal replication initiator protein
LQSVVEKFVKNVKREISIDYIQKTVSDYFQLDLECYNQKQEKTRSTSTTISHVFLLKNSQKLL